MAFYSHADECSSDSPSMISINSIEKRSNRSRSAYASCFSSLSPSIGKRNDSGFLSDDDNSAFGHGPVSVEDGHSVQAGLAKRDMLRLRKEPSMDYHYDSTCGDDDDARKDWLQCREIRIDPRTFWVLVLLFMAMIATGIGLMATGNDPHPNNPSNNPINTQTDNIFDRVTYDPTLTNSANQIELPEQEEEQGEEQTSAPVYSEPLTARILSLQDLLVTESSPRHLKDPNSDQFAAMRWLADEDPAALNFAETPEKEIKDRYKAALLYFAMSKGEDWRESYSFLSASHICEWNDGDRGYAFEGIKCEEGEVTEITMDMNRLEGTIPTEIALFNLRSLGLASNKLSGSLPTEFGQMFKLKSLKLGSNQFVGTVPTEIAGLLSLETLTLFDNNIEGTVPSEYKALVNLEQLYIEGTGLTGEVDSSLCSRKSKFKNFYASCDSDRGIKCSCCTYCCDGTGTTCRGVV